MLSFMTSNVTVRGRPVYRCFAPGCEVKALGDTVTIEAPCIEWIELRLVPTPHAMPVGWSSYGRYCYRCPEHAR